MSQTVPMAMLACAGVALLAASPAFSHAVCGGRIFPVTLTLDDPGVSDEATLPQVVYQRGGADGGPGPTHDTSVQFEYDKRITEDTAIIFNDDTNINQTNDAKTETGWDDLTVTGKYATCISVDSEFIFGVGVIREFGRTGTSHIDSDEFGNTAPTLYFGKGLTELPVPVLRPLGITGEVSYAMADKGFKEVQVADPASGVVSTQANNGNPNQWIGGLSLQYSIPYLQSQVKNYGLPDFVGHLIPLVEVTWTSPTTSPGNSPTTWTVAPGVIYLGDWFQVGLEALVPANKAAGTNVGVIAQFHIFLDDLLPNTLGAPLVRF